MDPFTSLYLIFISVLGALIIANFVLLIVVISKNRNLTKLANSLNAENLKQLTHDLDELKKCSEKSFQKVGVVKFNPFKSMGGNLSFAVALLNKRNSGIIISGLHNRESTRVYVKEIPYGKDTKIELSSEEKKALEEAIKS